MNKIEERKLKKQEKIMNTTIQLFLDKGLKHTTMDDIAYHSNVSKVTIYKYFGDKESFNLSILDVIVNQYKEKIEMSFKDAKGVESEMVSITEVMVEFIAVGLSALCDDLIRVTVYDPMTLGQYDKKTLSSLIEVGKSKRIIKEGLDTEVIYHYIDMGLSYFKHNAIYRKKMQSDKDFRKAYMSLIWGSIFTDTSSFNT